MILDVEATPVTVGASTVTGEITGASAPDLDATNRSATLSIMAREQATFWHNANRDAGTAATLAYSTAIPKNGAAGTLFVGTDGGGVYRSIDTGDNWFPTDLIDVNTRGLVISNASGAVWAITYDAGAYRSVDLGDTFPLVFDATTVIPGPATGSDRLLAGAVNNYSPVNGGEGDVFLGSEDKGVFYTSDAGASWTNVTYNLPVNVIRSFVVKQDGLAVGQDRVFVGTHGRGVWYIDYTATPVLGAVWMEANGAGTLDRAVVHALAVEPSGAVYAATDDGVYRTTDNGVTWTHILPDVVGRSLLVFDDGTEYILAGTDGDYIFRAATAAPGVWTQYDGLTTPPDGTVSGLQSRTVLSLLYADDALYAGTQDEGVHRSTDGGVLWEQVSAELTNAVIQALLFNTSNGYLYAGTYGYGILFSDDFDGTTPVNWTRTSNGLTNPWIYALALNSKSGIDNLFAGTWSGGVFRSIDDGETWFFSGLADRMVYDMAVSSTGIIYAATNSGEVSRSVDNGLVWQDIGVGAQAITALVIDPASPLTIYAGTMGAGIYKSVDGGATWTQTGLVAGHVHDFAFDGADLYAATSTGVMVTANAGTTWADFSTGLSVVDVRAIALTGVGLIAGTWGDGVYRYDTVVASWIRDGLPEMPIITFAVNPEDGEVFVTTDDGGLFRRNYPKVVSTEDLFEFELPEAYILKQNYPNPFNPETRISFGIPESGLVQVVVYDALGRQIRVLVDGALHAGMHTVVFDARDLPSGVYFYRMVGHGQVLDRRMVLMK